MSKLAMTRFLDARDVATLVRAIGPDIALAQLADEIRSDFLRWRAFETCARVAHHSPVGVIELMPVTDGMQYAFKYVNGHPRNARHGLPTVMAFGVLADVSTGLPVLLADLTLATALRTAATSALAARAMARPGAATMALIGNGAQAEFQALAFHAMVGIREVRAYDIDPVATARLRRNLAHVAGLAVVPAASVRDAVASADIVSTVTADKARATILTADMVAPGVHINAVGGDCPGKTELHAELVRRARVAVEYAPQTRIEGEIQQLPDDFPVTELWRILSGKEPGRTSPDDITIFDSVGFALEDYAALRWLHACATEREVGRRIELVAAPADTRDLYGWLMAPAGPAAASASATGAAEVLQRQGVVAG